MTKTKETKKMEEKKVVGIANNSNCKISTRGRVFEGVVVKKFPNRIMIQFEKTIYVTKYERYAKSRTKIHARLPIELEKEINLGDLIQVQECRPLSKIIHFMVIRKIKDASEVTA